MPPGTRVVSWTSKDSEVTRWPLRTLRISVVSDLCGVSFSKGYIAEGKTFASAAAASEGMIPGRKAAGSMVHKSRRETDIVVLLLGPQDAAARTIYRIARSR